MKSSLLILTDLPGLGRVVQSLVHATGKIDAAAYTFHEYRRDADEDRPPDLVVMDLFRVARGQVWAQGLSLATQGFASLPCLLISPLCMAERLGCPGYWDAQSEDSLERRVLSVLESPEGTRRNMEQLSVAFQSLTSPPLGHPSFRDLDV